MITVDDILGERLTLHDRAKAAWEAKKACMLAAWNSECDSLEGYARDFMQDALYMPAEDAHCVTFEREYRDKSKNTAQVLFKIDGVEFHAFHVEKKVTTIKSSQFEDENITELVPHMQVRTPTGWHYVTSLADVGQRITP